MADNNQNPATHATEANPLVNPNDGSTVTTIDAIVGTDKNTCRYIKKRHLGQGNFGNAWRVEEVATGQAYAAKVMNTNSMSVKDRGFVANEVRCLARCSHPNIVRHILSADLEGMLLIVMEYADGGDLYKQIKARQGPQMRYFKEHEIWFIFVQLCLALDHIHQKKMMHRDIKTANVLLTATGLVKLGDFGFSRQYEDSLSNPVGSTFCGTPYYLSPELWRRSVYSKKSEMWALGVVLYETMALKRPFGGADMNQLIDNIIHARFEPLPDMYSPELRAICGSLLQLDPNQRPSLRDIFATAGMRDKGLLVLRRSVEGHARIPTSIQEQLIASIDEALNPQATQQQQGDQLAAGPQSGGDANVRVEPRKTHVMRHMGSQHGWQHCVLEMTPTHIIMYGLNQDAMNVDDAWRDVNNYHQDEAMEINIVTSVCPIEPNITGENYVFALKNQMGKGFWFKEATDEGFQQWLVALHNALHY